MHCVRVAGVTQSRALLKVRVMSGITRCQVRLKSRVTPTTSYYNKSISRKCSYLIIKHELMIVFTNINTNMNTCIHIYIHTYTHKKYKPSQTGSEGGLGRNDVMLKVSVHRVFIFVKNFNFQNSTFFFSNCYWNKIICTDRF